MKESEWTRQAGQILRDIRLKSGISQVVFVERLGEMIGTRIASTTLSGWETGHRTMPAAALVAATAMAAEAAGATPSIEAKIDDVSARLDTLIEVIAKVSAPPADAPDVGVNLTALVTEQLRRGPLKKD